MTEEGSLSAGGNKVGSAKSPPTSQHDDMYIKPGVQLITHTGFWALYVNAYSLQETGSKVATHNVLLVHLLLFLPNCNKTKIQQKHTLGVARVTEDKTHIHTFIVIIYYKSHVCM